MITFPQYPVEKDYSISWPMIGVLTFEILVSIIAIATL